MRIRLAAILAFLFLSSCGEPEAPVPDAPPAIPSAPGEFRLEVAAEGWPGRRAPVSIEGDGTDVTIRFLRCGDPVRAFSPEPSPVEPAIEWDQVASIPAGDRMPRLRAGLYRVVASRDDREEETRLLVTDLLPVFASSGEEVLVLVTDAMTGEAVPRARVLITGPAGVRSGAADAEGVFRASFRAEGRLRIVVVAEGRCGSIVVTPEAVAPTSAWLTFDQEEYEPGDTVRFAGLLRDVRRLRPVRLQKRSFTIRDGNRLLFYRGEVEDGPAALFTGSFPIPDVCRPGVFELAIGEIRATVSVVAPEPRSPELEVRWAEGPRFPGVPVGFEIEGEWPDGAPMAGQRVRYKVVDRAGAVMLEGRATLDSDGRLATSFLAARGGEHRLEVRAEVPGDERVGVGANVRIAPAAFTLTATAASRHVPEGDPVVVSVAVSPEPDPASPVPARIEAAGETLAITVPTEVELDLPPGMHRIRVTAQDADGNLAEDECGVVVARALGFGEAEWSGAITLVADQSTYEPGDVARLLVFVPAALAGKSMLLTGDGLELGSHRVLAGSGGSRVVSVEIPEDATADRELVLRTVRNRKVREARTRLTVLPRRRAPVVSLGTDEDGLLRIRATDGDGRAIEGVAILTMRDGNGRALDFRAGLRLDGEGTSEGVALPPAAFVEAGATVVSPDGAESAATATFSSRDRAPLRIRPPSFLPVLPSSTPVLRHFAGRLPAGRSDLDIHVPEGAVGLTVRLTGGVRAVLREVVPTLGAAPDWPAERLESRLLGLHVMDRLASFGIGEHPEDREVARVLAGLAALGRADGRTGLPEPDDSVASPDEAEVEALLARRRGVEWGSPGETAAAVRALLPAIAVDDDRRGSLRVRYGPALLGACELDAERARTFEVPSELLTPGRTKLVFEKGGDLPVDYVVTLRVRSESPRKGGPLLVSREWAKAARDGRAPHRGEILRVALTVSSEESRKRVVVSCPLPAGAGVVPGGHPLPKGVLREIRDDRILFFVPEVGAKPVVMTFELRVTHRGEFRFRRAAAWPLDRPEERSESPAERLTFR